MVVLRTEDPVETGDLTIVAKVTATEAEATVAMAHHHKTIMVAHQVAAMVHHKADTAPCRVAAAPA